MRRFDYAATARGLLTPEIVRDLIALHEHKGRQELYLEANKEELSTLLDVAIVQSTGASNRIEGICADDRRIESIVRRSVEPRDRSEQEIAGYRDVLATIHADHEHIPLSPGVIRQFHRDLYSYTDGAPGGAYKTSDNVIAGVMPDGTQRVRFTPTPAWQTEDAVRSMCDAFASEWQANAHDRFLLTALFVLDFLCVHPFNDGNGRISRLLTLLLLYRAGCVVGRYISLEALIERTKDSYYDTLEASSAGWHENTNDPSPFVSYLLGVLLRAYADFEGRVEMLRRGTTKADRVKAVIDRSVGKITKREIISICPDISEMTVARALNDLCRRGYIKKVDAGPASGYIRS